MSLQEKLTELYWDKYHPTINQEQETIEFMLSKEVLELLLPLYEVTAISWMNRQVSVREGK